MNTSLLSRIGAAALGLTLGAGCVSYDQKALYDRLAGDMKIDAKDYTAFVRAEARLQDLIETQEGDEKARSQALLNDFLKVKSKYEENVHIKVQPTFSFTLPNGEPANLDQTHDSKVYILDLSFGDIVKAFTRVYGDAEKAAVEAHKLYRKASPTWESTYGEVDRFETFIYRTNSVDELSAIILALCDIKPENRAAIVEVMKLADGKHGIPLPYTSGIRPIIDGSVELKKEDLESLTNLKPTEVQSEEPAEEVPAEKSSQ